MKLLSLPLLCFVIISCDASALRLFEQLSQPTYNGVGRVDNNNGYRFGTVNMNNELNYKRIRFAIRGYGEPSPQYGNSQSAHSNGLAGYQNSETVDANSQSNNNQVQDSVNNLVQAFIDQITQALADASNPSQNTQFDYNNQAVPLEAGFNVLVSAGDPNNLFQAQNAQNSLATSSANGQNAQTVYSSANSNVPSNLFPPYFWSN